MGDTVRVELDGGRYSRLQLLAITRHTSPEQALAELVDDEADRVLGPKRNHKPGDAAKRLAEALGWETVPEISGTERAELQAKLEQSEADARRIYGDKPLHSAA